jgi:DNA-binding transcriptional regulator YiaG
MTSVVDSWTGARAAALRAALRLTNEALADRLGTSVRAVSNWNTDPALVQGLGKVVFHEVRMSSTGWWAARA